MKKVNCIKVILSLCLVMSCITNIIVYAMGIYAVEADQYQYITISRSSATLKRGEGILVTATTYPLTGDAYAYWYSSNPSVASVNNGYIVGHSAGTAIITAQYRGDVSEAGITEVDCSVTVTNSQVFENGIYFIQNITTGTYLDIKGSYSTEGSQIHLWELTGNHSRKWELYLIGTGYYTIQSYHPSSQMFIGIEQDSTTTNGATVHQYDYSTGYNTQWSFMLTDSGNYAMIPRSGEERMFALRASSSSTSNGVVTHQRKYTNNSNYQDEWKLHRMLPLSGSELSYDMTEWTNNPLRNFLNCYSYVINNQTKTDGGIYWKQIPGDYADYDITGYAINPLENNILINALFADYSAHNTNNNTNFICESIGRYEACAQGTYKIALVVNPLEAGEDGSANSSDFDYHWYRQDSDGLWSHKQGNSNSISRKDESNKLIIDPQTANRGEYTVFVGYFMVTPWNHYYDGMNDEYLSLGEDYFVQSASISLSLVNRVEIGMTVERVISILGSVGTVIGNEYPISIYECADGSVVTISYNYNVEQKTFVVSEISDRSIV